VSVEKQKEFIALYEEMKRNLQKDTVILFMDGVHPDHQTQNVHGWIHRGVVAQVPSTAKQLRVHYMGAVEVREDAVTHTVKEYEKINSVAVIDFLQELQKKYPGKHLKIICDQGAYHKSEETKNYVINSGAIELIYLPPRCPNLNLIERLWKILREHVTYNKYYHKFDMFKKACNNFFNKTLYEISDLVTRRLKDNFHIIHPSFVTD
jgi:transposase